MKRNWLNRQHFRDNWPLWLAGFAIVFSLICLLYTETIPQYPDYSRSRVIYPLLIFATNVIILIPVILFVSLATLGIWALLHHNFNSWTIFGIALLINGATCYFCAATALFGFGVSHFQTLEFYGRIYHVGKFSDNSDWDTPSTSFIVYECDQLGILCTPIYLSYGFYTGYDLYFDDILANTKLFANPLDNMLYFQVNKDIVYVKDIETVTRSAPVRLPPLTIITNANAVQLTEIVKYIRGSTSQLAWSPDGETLAVGGQFSYLIQSDLPGVWLYNLGQIQDKPRLLQIDYQGHPGLSAESVAFSPDGRLLAAGGYDYTVRLWDVESGEQIAVLPGHGDTVDAVAFSPDGKLLASGSWYHEVWLWDVDTHSIQAILNDEYNSGGLYSLAFSPDGKQLVSAGSEMHIWDVDTHTLTSSIPLPLPTRFSYPSVYSVAYSPSGDMIAYAGWENLLRLWNVQDNTEVGVFEVPGNTLSIYSIAFNPDGSLLATGNSDGTVRIWDVETQTQLVVLEGHANEVRSVAFNPDGKILASSSRDGTVRLWGMPQS
jgi:WD40 repeat protein